jgi:hypothetical protein
MSLSTLDECVFTASKELHGRGAPDPEVLFLMATGLGLLPTAYQSSWQMPLEKIAGVPRAWRNKTLFAAERKDATFWFLEDAPGEESFPSSSASDREDEAWVRAFPTWLAACSGATICVHTSAGTTVGETARPGLGLVSDHINLSGRSPLHGLGESRLGPLFPDQSQIHHPGLRKLALKHGRRLGINVQEGVVACTSGPTIETTAERLFYGRAGADFAVQGLSDALISMSHAGLACLSVVGLIDGDNTGDVGDIVESAEALAPSLEELLGALGHDLATAAFEMREEV